MIIPLFPTNSIPMSNAVMNSGVPFTFLCAIYNLSTYVGLLHYLYKTMSAIYVLIFNYSFK